MAEASRRASRKPARGGSPNALFVVASAESLPCELDGAFEEVTVHFPWGSLLRGVVAGDPAIVAGLARMLVPGGRLKILVSITQREAGAGLAVFDESRVEDLQRRYAEQGLELIRACRATEAEIDASHSTWAKRLGRQREAWSLQFRRST